MRIVTEATCSMREVDCDRPPNPPVVLRRPSVMQPLIEQHPLRRGSHPSRDDGVCAMEMVAWLAGEKHSDEPRCACPVIGALVRACNDAMSDELRNRFLRPLVPQIVGTRASAAVERARGHVVIDGLVRTLVPAALRRQRRHEVAELIENLPEIRRLEDVRTALRVIEAFARDQHATTWVLQRALEGTAPARYVAGAVQVARMRDDAATWAATVAIVE